MKNLAQTIKENQENLRNKQLFKRDYSFPKELFLIEKIHTLVGARRVGKTSVMIQRIQTFEKEWLLAYEDIVFLDYATLQPSEYPSSEQLLEAFHSIHPGRTPRFFLDEIQSDPDFKYTLLKLYNQWYKIFVTWSNSKLLSHELATELRGRSYEFHIQGLSFVEYCRFRGKEIHWDGVYTATERGTILHLMQEYLSYGTYPELALSNNKTIATSLIDGYLNTLLYRDIQERYGKNITNGIEYLIKQLVISNTKYTSLHKVYQDLKSQWKKISKDSVYNFMDILQQVFFVSEVADRYKPKAQKKYFLNDRWYMQLFSNKENFWQKWEHCIYLHLLRNWETLSYSNSDGREIDFVTNNDDRIQVCYQLHKENYAREIEPLVASKNTTKILYLYEATTLSIPESIEVRNIFSLL